MCWCPFLEKKILSPPIPFEEIQDMSVRNEMEADIQNNDSEVGIDNIEIIHQREPPPSMSGLDEIETEINGPHGMDQNDVEGEVQQEQIAEESEIIHQREPPPSMSGLDEIETEINGPQGMDQNDVEGEVQQEQIAEESDNQEVRKNQKKRRTENDTFLESYIRRQAQAPVKKSSKFGKIIKYVAGGAVIVGIAAVAGPRAAGKFSAPGLGVAGAGELISPTAQLAGAGIGIATNVINVAAKTLF